MLPGTTDWHPEDLKAALRKKGLTQDEIAANAGVSRRTVGLTIHGGKSAKVCQYIAELLGLPPEQIWPSRYQVVRVRGKG